MSELNNQMLIEMLDRMVSFIETTMSDFSEKLILRLLDC